MKDFVTSAIPTISHIHFNDKWYDQTWSLAIWYVSQVRSYIDSVLDMSMWKLISKLDKLNNDCQELITHNRELEAKKNEGKLWFIKRITKNFALKILSRKVNKIHKRISTQIIKVHNEVSKIIWTNELSTITN